MHLFVQWLGQEPLGCRKKLVFSIKIDGSGCFAGGNPQVFEEQVRP